MRGARWRAVGGAAAAAVSCRFAVQAWEKRWRATDEEETTRLPGDDRVAEPATQVTRAITVAAPAEAIWPWLVQLGADRGGFYSYDWLENLIGLGIHSADAVVADWQQRAVGDLVAADARRSAGWYVVELQRNEVLALQLADVRTGRTVRRTDRPGWEFLWTFALRPGNDGATRLLVRERAGFAHRATRLAFGPLGLVSFVMTRKMLLGIKTRSEAARHRAHAPGPAPPRGLARAALRAPVHLYGWHLGRLLGRRFVLLEHRGRRTGRLHRTVLEVVDHDEDLDRVVVCAGWGEGADWYRNVTARPEVGYATGGIHRDGLARRLDRGAAAVALEHYGERHPRALRGLARRFLGAAPPTSAAAVEEMAAVLPVVELAASSSHRRLARPGP